MSKLNIEKIKQIKESFAYTQKDIEAKTKISKGAIGDVMSPKKESNPTIFTLLELADLFECTVDDFIDYDKQNKAYFSEGKISRIAEYIYENPDLHALFNSCLNLTSDELKVLNECIKTFKQQHWLQK